MAYYKSYTAETQPRTPPQHQIVRYDRREARKRKAKNVLCKLNIQRLSRVDSYKHFKDIAQDSENLLQINPRIEY